jgi:hypothetical protein
LRIARRRQCERVRGSTFPMAALTHSLTEEQDRGSERAGEVPVLMRTRRPAILRCHQDALRARDEGFGRAGPGVGPSSGVPPEEHGCGGARRRRESDRVHVRTTRRQVNPSDTGCWRAATRFGSASREAAFSAIESACAALWGTSAHARDRGDNRGRSHPARVGVGVGVGTTSIDAGLASVPSAGARDWDWRCPPDAPERRRFPDLRQAPLEGVGRQHDASRRRELAGRPLYLCARSCSGAGVRYRRV